MVGWVQRNGTFFFLLWHCSLRAHNNNENDNDDHDDNDDDDTYL